MKLIGWEIKKAISSKWIVALAVVLLLVCIITASIVSESDKVGKEVVRNYVWYVSHGTEADAYRQELMELFMEHKQEEDYQLPRTLSSRESVDDLFLLDCLREKKESLESFKEATGRNIRIAETRALEQTYFLGPDDYTVRYYNRMAEAYAKVQLQPVTVSTFSYGYDKYFSNQIIPFLPALFTIMIASFVCLFDKTCGMDIVIAIGKRGKLATQSAKMCAIVAGSAGFTILTHLVALAVTAISFGLSSPFYPVQSLPGFENVPYTCNILAFILLHLGLRLLGTVCFGMLTAFFAVLFRKHLFSMTGTILFGILQLVLFLWHDPIKTHTISFFNLAALTEATEISTQFIVFRFFNQPVSLLLLLFSASFLLTLGLYILNLFLSYLMSENGRSPLKKRNTAARFQALLRSGLEKARTVLTSHLHLIGFEFVKMKLYRVVCIALILFSVQCIMTIAATEGMHGLYEAKYYRYMETLRSIDTSDARLSQVSSDLSRTEAVILQEHKMNEAFLSGDISNEDYTIFQNQLYEAKADQIMFQDAYRYLSYLDVQSEMTGKDLKPEYTKGYNTFFQQGPDYLLFLILVLVSYGTYCVEFRSQTESSAMILIMRCTKKGRVETYWKKILLVGTSGTIFALLFTTARLVIIWSRYPFPDLSGHLWSSELFGNVLPDVSFGFGICFRFVEHALLAFLMSASLGALSYYQRGTLQALTTDLTLLAIPEVAYVTLFHKMPFVSIISLWSPLRILYGVYNHMQTSAFVSWVLFCVAGISGMTVFLWGTSRKIQSG